MDLFLALFSYPYAAAIFALFVFFFVNVAAAAAIKRNLPPLPPEPFGRLPVIGHLHHLLIMSLIRRKKKNPLPLVLGDMSDRLGPVFMLRLGGWRPTVIVSDSSAARELFTANDVSISSRAPSSAFDVMSVGGTVFSLSPYGPYWRSMRKIATVKLFSAARLDAFRHLWVAEIAEFVADLRAAAPATVEMNGRIFDTVYNIMLRVIVGKRYFGTGDGGGSDEEAQRFRRLIAECFRHLSTPLPADVFPFLGKLDVGGQVREMRKTMKEMDGVMQGLLEEHKSRRRREGCSGAGAGDGDRDFMELMMMSLAEEPEPFDIEDDTMTKATSLALILGGMDTTVVATTSAVKNLLNNPEALRRLEAEIDDEVGTECAVAASDLRRLPYLHAVVKESMRLSPTAPLLVPRLAVDEFQLAGFSVPAGSHLIVNAWKVQRDPRVWSPEPEAFRPERFLAGEGGAAAVDVKGANHELIPFGSGRRGCPGIPLAMQVIPFLLARLVQAFKLGMPDGAAAALDSDPSLDPLDVIVTPRQPVAFYSN